MSELIALYTPQGESLDGQPWSVYPRPQLRRKSFFCLNGQWDFTVTAHQEIPTTFDRSIRVPFPPESLLSGLAERYPEDHYLWYRRHFTLPEGFQQERVLLHIGAADQHATVYVNGSVIGSHSGGYEAFSLDITDVLKKDNVLTVRVEDRLSDFMLPYGKQCQKRGGMWYTPVSGIWQTVWLESVPETYIRRLTIDTNAEGADITAEGVVDGTLTVQTPNGALTFPMVDGHTRVDIPAPRLWSPEDPYLYTFTITTPTDRVESYFALRTLEIRTIKGVPRLCLNGKPYFFHGLLDQGYWSDGLFTPATPACYENDIRAMKALGFNMLRKHIKVEPEQFYYDCDRLGMVVFQDMVNNGTYSFFRDTALPTIGLQRLNDRFLHRDPKTRQCFVEGMEQTVRQLYNHPCICYWTIFNEGWGQFKSSAMYHLLRKWDDSRFIDSASGWFAGGETDVDSRHVYFRKVKLKASDKPLVLSEFGGYSFKPEGHVSNTEKTYGYGRCETRESLVDALRRLYTEEVLPLIPQGLCAAVYTQVSDVEDETNGLLSYDRWVEKVKPEEFVDISSQLYTAIE